MIKKWLAIFLFFSLIGINFNIFAFAYDIDIDSMSDFENFKLDNFDIEGIEDRDINIDNYVDGYNSESDNETENVDEYLGKKIPPVIVQDTEITMFDKIESDITVKNGAKLKIGPNVKIMGHKIIVNGGSVETDSNVILDELILKNANKIKLGSNNVVNKIEGDVNSLIIGSNTIVKFLAVNAKEKVDLGANVTIERIYLTTDNLKISSNTVLKTGNIYVYGNIEGQANNLFNGKITTFSNFAVSANNGFKGRVCLLNNIYLGANTQVVTYNFGGLLGNIDPILNVKITDTSAEFKKIKEIAKNFDEVFNNSLKKIILYSKRINFLNNKAKVYKLHNDERNYDRTVKLIERLKSRKENMKEKMYGYIDEIFGNLAKYIQDDEKPRNLFRVVKDMYKNAVKYETFGLVKQICANSKVVGEANSMFVKNGEIIIHGLRFRRYRVIDKDLKNKIITLLKNKDKDKLFEIEYKINNILSRAIKKKNGQLINALVDLENIIRGILFYDN